jgi:hypothetical protein
VRLKRALLISALLILTACGNSNIATGIATPEQALRSLDFDEKVELCSFTEEWQLMGASPEKYASALWVKSSEWRIREGIRKIQYLSENNHLEEFDENFETVPQGQAKEILSACEVLKKDDYKLKLQVKNAISKKWDQILSKEKLLSEALEREFEKIKPTLKYWNEKASKSGSGDLGDYLTAISSAEREITAGAQYSLTGASREVQSSTCWATDRSQWNGGNPSGWWLCGINFVGSDFELFSIEFSNGSWSGKPDRGSQAGRELNWKIPGSVLDWVNENGSGT